MPDHPAEIAKPGGQTTRITEITEERDSVLEQRHGMRCVSGEKRGQREFCQSRSFAGSISVGKCGFKRLLKPVHSGDILTSAFER